MTPVIANQWLEVVFWAILLIGLLGLICVGLYALLEFERHG